MCRGPNVRSLISRYLERARSLLGRRLMANLLPLIVGCVALGACAGGASVSSDMPADGPVTVGTGGSSGHPSSDGAGADIDAGDEAVDDVATADASDAFPTDVDLKESDATAMNEGSPLDADGGCECVPSASPSASATEVARSLDCVCAAGVCDPVPRGTQADCIMGAPGVMNESVRWYDDCGLVVVTSASLDGPGREWTLDAANGVLVGIRYNPWTIGMFERHLYCGPPDARVGPIPTVVAGRTADGCTQSRAQQVCPPGAKDGGIRDSP